MTSSPNPGLTIVCWLFAHYHALSGNVVYRLRAEDCHPGVGSRVTAGTVQPEAIMIEVDRGDELVVGWRPMTSSTTWPTTTEDQHFTTDDMENETVLVDLPGSQKNDDWSFLDGQQVISLYDEPDIVPLSKLDRDLSDGRYDVTGKNNARQSGFGSEILIEKPLLLAALLVVILHAVELLSYI